MPVSRFRYLPHALGLSLLAASCASFVSMTPYHFKSGPIINESNTAVLVNGSGSNLVAFAEGRNKVQVHTENGSNTGYTHNLSFNIKAMAPGVNLELWALSTANKLHRIKLGSAGNLISVSPGVSVVNGEDIAVSANGSSIYIVNDTHIYRYNTLGNLLASVALPRSGASSSSGSAQRVAFDAAANALYALDAVTLTSGGGTPALRLTRYNADFSSPSVGDYAITDSHIHLRDFEMSDGHMVWERSAGSNPSKLEFVSAGQVYHSINVDYGTNMAAGSLSSAGVKASFADCGGSSGAYLWRSRTNYPFNMLERHTVCEN